MEEINDHGTGGSTEQAPVSEKNEEQSINQSLHLK